MDFGQHRNSSIISVNLYIIQLWIRIFSPYNLLVFLANLIYGHSRRNIPVYSAHSLPQHILQLDILAPNSLLLLIRHTAHSVLKEQQSTTKVALQNGKFDPFLPNVLFFNVK